MANNNDVVFIKLDRERELRFGHKALKTITALTGMSVEQILSGELNFEQIEKIIYCGLLSDDKELKLEQMEDLLDAIPNPKYYIKKMNEALAISFGVGEEEEGNEPAGK